MTGEQFLNSIRHLDYEITALDHTRTRLEGQRQDILDRAMSNAALTGVCVQHGARSKTEALGVQLADMITPGEAARRIERLQARVNRKIDELVDRKERALTVVERMQSPRCKTLILQRYLNNLKWTTIADLMGYNEHYVRVDLKREAVAEFSAIFERPTENYLSFRKQM